jgi:GMP synthase (glutamine-hydrolysing)
MIAIISCGSDKVPLIKKHLDKIFVESHIIDMAKTREVNFYSYSGVIISGSPILVTDEGMDTHLTHFAFLENFPKPVLGICFGHQVIGLLYGATGILGKMIKGDKMVVQTKESPLFAGIKKETIFAQNHCESITLPKDFERIATSDLCDNEAMQHVSKQSYGVQFHPEVSGAVGEALIQNFARLCGDLR